MNRPAVDANYRFIAASQEVNARILQRQQALTLYVTLVVSLLAALVALRPMPGQLAPPVEWLLLGFPLASMSFALVSFQAERALSNLRTFLSELERLDPSEPRLPAYNTEPRWSTQADAARRFRDLAAVLLAAGGNAIGLSASWYIHPQRLGWQNPVLLLSVGLAVASLVILLITPRWSYRPLNAPGSGR
jgi:hypothetical protein